MIFFLAAAIGQFPSFRRKPARPGRMPLTALAVIGRAWLGLPVSDPLYACRLEAGMAQADAGRKGWLDFNPFQWTMNAAFTRGPGERKLTFGKGGFSRGLLKMIPIFDHHS